MRAFLRDWLGALTDGVRALGALPLLAAILFALEFGQHIVEVRLGMFSGDVVHRAQVAMAPNRIMLGWVKMAMTFGFAFFVIRWGVMRDAGRALRAPPRAWRRYAAVAGFQFAMAFAVIYAPRITAPFGKGEPVVSAFRLTVSLIQQLAEPLLALWFVNAAMGTSGCGPIASLRRTRWIGAWGFLLILLVRFPLGGLHQLLNRWPTTALHGGLWAMLALDAAVVPPMVSAIAMAQLRVAKRVASRRGIPLLIRGDEDRAP